MVTQIRTVYRLTFHFARFGRLASSELGNGNTHWAEWRPQRQTVTHLSRKIWLSGRYQSCQIKLIFERKDPCRVVFSLYDNWSTFFFRVVREVAAQGGFIFLSVKFCSIFRQVASRVSCASRADWLMAILC